MELKTPEFRNPVDASQLKALKEASAELFRKIPDPSQEISIRKVRTGETLANSSDRYIVADARGGPIRIALPIPLTRQYLEIKNGYTTKNAVTVVRIDGKPLGNGNVSAVAPEDANGAAMRLLADGDNANPQWWVL